MSEDSNDLIEDLEEETEPAQERPPCLLSSGHRVHNIALSQLAHFNEMENGLNHTNSLKC